MANYYNHLIDPFYHQDTIAEFGFTYDWYVQDKIEKDELFRQIVRYKKLEIYGSLQPQNSSLNINSSTGNTMSTKYDFYCLSEYRIKPGDFILYKNKWLHCDGIHDYDEMGVRNAFLTEVNLNDYKDLKESIKYLNGEEII